MQITKVTVCNFRSIKDASFLMNDYTMLVGANNSGKTNLVDAIRVFYGEGLSFSKKDEHEFKHNNDCWIEIEYQLNDEEYVLLPEKYQLPDNRLIVKNYLNSNSKKGMYGYILDENSHIREDDSNFFGAKNVPKGKLGSVIYIPAVSTLADQLKLSGPSAFRDVITKIMTNIVASSSAFEALITEYNKQMTLIRNDETSDGLSIKGFEDSINVDISEWGVGFHFNINPPDESQIIKYLVDYSIFDNRLNTDVTPERFGQGFQRHLIFSVIKRAAEFQALGKRKSKKKDFQGNLTLLLFEEPEAFLHPPQQVALCVSLRKISEEEGNQVLISSHSANFVSQKTNDLCSIARLMRTEKGITEVRQISESRLQTIISDNNEINTIVSHNSDDELPDMESIKYFMWLDSKRCSLFFAGHVLLVEGPTEVAFINRLMSEGHIQIPDGGLFIMDTIGKWNFHRFMHILGELGIKHSILHDKDQKTNSPKKLKEHAEILKLIQKTANKFTHKIQEVDNDIENFLEVDPTKPSHRKPQHLMLRYEQKMIKQDRLDAFIKLVNETIQ